MNLKFTGTTYIDVIANGAVKNCKQIELETLKTMVLP